MGCNVATIDAYVTSWRWRKKVEMLFVYLKRISKLDRLRLRGSNGAKEELLPAATAQNLRKLAITISMPAWSTDQAPLVLLPGAISKHTSTEFFRHNPTISSGSRCRWYISKAYFSWLEKHLTYT